MQLNNQPKHILLKIKENINKIKTLSSSELLHYSIALKRNTDLDDELKDYLLDEVQLRTLALNSGIQQIRMDRERQMIEEFMNGRA